MDLICKKRLFITGIRESQYEGKVYHKLLGTDGLDNVIVPISPDLLTLVKSMSWSDVLFKFTVRPGINGKNDIYCRVANIEYCEGGVSDDSCAGNS